MSQGWKNIALIYTTNTQIYHITQIFLSEAQKLDITILVTVSFAPATANITNQMISIKQSRARIIVFIGTTTDQRIAIDNSLTHGLTGVAGYQWIGMHPSMHRALYMNSTGAVIPYYYEWLQGFIGLFIHVNPDSDVYKDYANKWSTALYDPETPIVDSSYISPIANFAYDACFMFAYALHHMIEVMNLDPMKKEHRDLYLSILQNISFEGVSGHVRIDENGDRPVSSYDIVNFQQDRLVKIGSVSADGQVTYLPDTKTMYMSGTNTKPLDMSLRPLVKINNSAVIGMIVGSSGCIILCLVLMIFTCYFRNHPVMKASSSIFLILMLIGVLSLAVSVIPRTLENHHPTPLICISELWLSNVGYSLIIGTLLVSANQMLSCHSSHFKLFYTFIIGVSSESIVKRISNGFKLDRLDLVPTRFVVLLRRYFASLDLTYPYFSSSQIQKK